MKPTRQTTRRRRTREPEFGDWRVPVAKPHEVEHLKTTPVSVVRRWRVQAAYWQSVEPVYEADYADDWQPVHGWKKVIRAAIGLLVLLPLSVVMVFALLQQLYHAAPVVGNFDFWQSEPVWFSVLGALVFMAIKFFRLIDPMLMFAYVAGHELTHALAALMCFGKVQAVSVDLDGGYVDTDTDNLFVALSPYFVPLWMLLWLGCFFVANWIVPFETYQAWFYAGFGFWWAFHIYWTLWVIPREQPDLLENGVVLSFMIIMLTNIAALLLVLRCFGVISLRGYARDFLTCAQDIYTTYHDLALWLLQQI
ncbi:MAG: hypothetical protein J6J97_07115 [Akkermansia sp.]|nr:hypothetical protein [Akkermansia sp.]MBQ2869670.1 hypothetical protein [Akkermansia sp.]MBQ8375577.1 hypothetical protein [Akkermansia sp.]